MDGTAVLEGLDGGAVGRSPTNSCGGEAGKAAGILLCMLSFMLLALLSPLETIGMARVLGGKVLPILTYSATDFDLLVLPILTYSATDFDLLVLHRYLTMVAK